MPNDVKLQSPEGKHPLDENLRPLKIGNKTAPLELSDTDVRVNNLYVNGTTTGVSATDDTKLPLAGGTMTGDITTDSNIVSTNLTIDDSGDITLDAAGGDVNILQADLSIPIDKKVIFGNTGEYIVGDDTDLDIVSSNNATIDAAGDIILNAKGDSIYLKNTTDVFGQINTATASTLKLTSNFNYHLNLVSLGTGDVVIDSNGDIILDSADGNFIAKKAGTEFSVANSAYAGMILGCTHVFGSGTGGVFVQISTAWENLLWDTDKFALVTFVVPPSNKVKISVHLPWIGAAANLIQLGLATDDSATTLGTKYENDVDDANRADSFNVNYSWVVEGSDHSWSAGETKTIYIMAYTASNVRFYTGGTNTSGYGGVIVEATALPATIGNGEEP